MATLGELAQGASCASCLEDQLAAMIWQLDRFRISAGGDILTISEIAAGASCFTCLPDKLAAAVFLLNGPGEPPVVPPVEEPCAFNPNLLSNNYFIIGYVDGDIANPDSNPPPGDSVVWDGTFKFNDGANKWYALDESGTLVTMGGDHLLCDAYLTWGFCEGNTPIWNLSFTGNPINYPWIGQKTGGLTPVGTYVRTGGTQASPASLVVGMIGGADIPHNLGYQQNCIPA